MCEGAWTVQLANECIKERTITYGWARGAWWSFGNVWPLRLWKLHMKGDLEISLAVSNVTFPGLSLGSCQQLTEVLVISQRLRSYTDKLFFRKEATNSPKDQPVTKYSFQTIILFPSVFLVIISVRVNSLNSPRCSTPRIYQLWQAIVMVFRFDLWHFAVCNVTWDDGRVAHNCSSKRQTLPNS